MAFSCVHSISALSASDRLPAMGRRSIMYALKDHLRPPYTFATRPSAAKLRRSIEMTPFLPNFAVRAPLMHTEFLKTASVKGWGGETSNFFRLGPIAAAGNLKFGSAERHCGASRMRLCSL